MAAPDRIRTRGFDVMRCVVEDVNSDKGLANVRTQFGERREVSTNFRTGVVPRVGEAWILKRSSGYWVFDMKAGNATPLVPDYQFLVAWVNGGPPIPSGFLDPIPGWQVMDASIDPGWEIDVDTKTFRCTHAGIYTIHVMVDFIVKVSAIGNNPPTPLNVYVEYLGSEQNVVGDTFPGLEMEVPNSVNGNPYGGVIACPPCPFIVGDTFDVEVSGGAWDEPASTIRNGTSVTITRLFS